MNNTMTRLDKIIFLDIDGVLNHEEYYKSAYKGYRIEKNVFPDGTGPYGSEYGWQKFCPRSKALLADLITATDAKIVISSTWRSDGLEAMKLIWKFEEMPGEVIDITPHLILARHEYPARSVPRGLEIQTWLYNKGFYHLNWSIERQQEVMNQSGISNYIIIDDDSDMLYEQRNHFVHCLPSPRNTSGFNEGYFEEALGKLSGTIINLNYGV